jgi:hypothetical protein
MQMAKFQVTQIACLFSALFRAKFGCFLGLLTTTSKHGILLNLNNGCILSVTYDQYSAISNGFK